MDLITILNRCHRFRGFVYQYAHFSADKKSIEVAVRPRKGSAAICSRCHRMAPGYDQLAKRRFESIPLWGFLVFLLYTMRRVDCRRCGLVAVEEVPWGDGKRTQSLYALPSPLPAASVPKLVQKQSLRIAGVLVAAILVFTTLYFFIASLEIP
jgi:hypothetical protein